MSKESERIEQLEKHVKELLDAKKKIDDQKQIRDEFAKFQEEQNKGVFPYIWDAFKILVLLAFLATSGSKAIDHPFIEKLIK
jgi:hypothetical protein